MMFTEQLTWYHLFTSLGFITGGVVIGVIIERIIFANLCGLARRTRWEGDEIIITAIRGVVIMWMGIIGIYAALQYLPLKANFNTIIQKILFIILIFSATIVITRIVTGLLRIHSKKTAALPSASLLINVTRILLFIMGILIIMQSIGISITPLITALGIGGLAVALALQPTLSNLFAGLQIIISKQVEVGDYVRLDTGEQGCVTDISWRNTTIREKPNNLIVIPNAKLADSILVNYNRPQKEMSVIVEVGVSYDSDLDKVERITIDVAKKVLNDVQGGHTEQEPFIYFHTFGDSSINFSVYLRVHEFINHYTIRHEFIKALHKRYNQEDINIPFPIRTVYIEGKK